MEKVLSIRLTKTFGLGLALVFVLSGFAGCQTDGTYKAAEVSKDICEKLSEYQGLATMGIDLVTSKIDRKEALEAQLIAHDTIDALVLLCELRDIVAERHKIEEKAAAAKAAEEAAAFKEAVEAAAAEAALAE